MNNTIVVPTLALTIKPRAMDLILAGVKRIENRSWRRDSIIGQTIALHRGRPGAGIVGIVTVLDIMDEDMALDAYPSQSPWINGPWCWLLGDLKRFPIIPCGGKLGLWKIGVRERNLIRQRLKTIG